MCVVFRVWVAGDDEGRGDVHYPVRATHIHLFFVVCGFSAILKGKFHRNGNLVLFDRRGSAVRRMGRRTDLTFKSIIFLYL